MHNSNLGPVLPHFRDIAAFWEERPRPSSTRFLVMFPLDIADVAAPRCEDLKLIIRVINFELVDPVRPRYVNATAGVLDGQTERQTDDLT